MASTVSARGTPAGGPQTTALRTGRRREGRPVLWISPSIVFFAAFILLPLVFALVISLYRWNGISRALFANFVGPKNYLKLFSDKYFLLALKNTGILVFGVTVIQNVFAYFLAVFIFFGGFKRADVIRAIIFYPSVVSAVVIALVWRQILMSDGVINAILDSVGVGGIDFLSKKSLVMWVITFICVWQGTGYNLVIIYAALQSLNLSVVEAAYVDGVNLWGLIFRVVFPILTPTIWLSVMLNFIGGFRVFDIVYILTRGGPAHASEVLTTYMYYNSFQAAGPNDMGYATAIAMFLGAIIIALTALRLKLVKEG